MGVVTISSLSFCFGRAGEILGQRRLYKIGVALYAAGAGLGAISFISRALIGPRGYGCRACDGLADVDGDSSGELRRQAARPSSWSVCFGDRRRPDDGSHHRRFASVRGRLAVDFLDELHHRSGGDGGSDKNLSRPRRPPPRTLRFPRPAGFADRLSRTFAGSDLRRQSRLDIALCRGLVRGRGYRARHFFLAQWDTTKPLIDVAIFRRKMLAAALLAVALSNMIHYPIALCAPLYLQNVLGSSALTAGLSLRPCRFRQHWLRRSAVDWLIASMRRRWRASVC